MAETERVEDWQCYFQHPSMGLGWRLAHVTIGRKWVYVRLFHGSKRVLKLRVSEWADFPKRPIQNGV
jgi:hypothetical protein